MPTALKGAEYETPADEAAMAACKVETVYNAQKKAIGYALRDGQGKLLRRFVDADGKGNGSVAIIRTVSRFTARPT